MGWLKYARKHELDSICESCERYISYSFSDITKEKLFIHCSLDVLKTTLRDLKGIVSAESLLVSVLSWINYDKKSRTRALDYTSDYLELKECREQFLTDSAKEHIDIFQSNPRVQPKGHTYSSSKKADCYGSWWSHQKRSEKYMVTQKAGS